ncbi:MAG: stage III sporulation protein AD [Caldicoprobacterales bacterium]|jgi:stage III sporulation protein AD|nr:stage III sporulation protein AD [Clostridiales bacterium]
MDIIQIVGIGIIAAILSMIIKQHKPEIAFLISIAAAILIFFIIANKLPYIVNVFNDIINKTQIDSVFISTLLKIVGVAYITEFGSQICKDMGENSIASKIELGGKVIIMILGLPILTALTETILEILP